jgi:hypothetical protein
MPFAVTDSGPDSQKESTDPRGTLVERYLKEHRGPDLPADLAVAVIRFHCALYFDPQTRHPGMVCLLRNIETDEPTGIHRTYLDRNTAAKIDRKMFGIAKGAAIKLDPTSGDTLTIGEGVETVMSARAAGYRPAWALGSSIAVKTFPVLKRPSEITILEENDPTSRRDVKLCKATGLLRATSTMSAAASGKRLPSSPTSGTRRPGGLADTGRRRARL